MICKGCEHPDWLHFADGCRYSVPSDNPCKCKIRREDVK